MRNYKSEKGSATIEAAISLTAFIFVIMAIYTLVNFCIIQAKISYAINTTAKEMSQYSYFYHSLGLSNLDKTLAKNKQQAVDTFGNISTLIDNSKAVINEGKSEPSTFLTEALKGGKTEDLTEIYKQIQIAQKDITGVINNPEQFLKSMAAIAGEKIWEKVKTNVVAAPMAKGMTSRHFGSTSKEANAYLESLGVVGGYDGINFNMSTLFEDANHQDIQIVAVYNLDLAALFPIDLKLTICQTATTRAWLGGDLKTAPKVGG